MKQIGSNIWGICWIWNGANQTSEENSNNVWIRTKFLEAVLRQDIAWYDTNTTSDFASKMTEDLNKIQDGIGEKMGMLVRFIVTFLGSLIYPYTQNWLVSLVISSVLPLMILFGGMKLCLKNKYIACLIMVIPRLYKTILSEKCYRPS